MGVAMAHGHGQMTTGAKLHRGGAGTGALTSGLCGRVQESQDSLCNVSLLVTPKTVHATRAPFVAVCSQRL